MNYQVLIVTAAIIFIIISLYKELIRPVIVFMIVVAVFLFANIIEPKEALTGFANDQIAVIFLLVVISEIIRKTGTLNVGLNKLFNLKLGYRSFISRLSFSVASVSSVVNNTPLVAIMLPYVYDWAKKKGISPSKVLLPLSYAAILGGTVTLIGTSTNLVVNALATEASKANHDIPVLKIFDFSPVGIPLMLIGCAYIVLYGFKILPSRTDPLSEFEERSRDYLAETFVPPSSTYIGKTVSQAMRNLRSVFLVEIHRNNERLSPVDPDDVIRREDVLIFAGATEKIIDMIKNPRDLSLPVFSPFPDHEKAHVVEVVVSGNSSLIGKKVRQTSFRGLYDAAIVAIKRDGEKLQGSIGEVELKSGDLLLLIAGNDFNERTRNAHDFYIISTVKELPNFDRGKTAIVVASVILAFLVSGIFGMPLFKALLIPIALIAFLKMINMEDLKNSIDIDLFLVLALALGVGKAITNSGAATLFADWILKLTEPFHSPMAALTGIYVLTNILSMLVTNKAAVAITFPITMAMVSEMRLTTNPDLSYTPFLLAIAYAGCAEFITPFGYQTNLMVYGPGGYKFKDYVRFGTPLTFLFMIVALLILGYNYNLY